MFVYQRVWEDIGRPSRTKTRAHTHNKYKYKYIYIYIYICAVSICHTIYLSHIQSNSCMVLSENMLSPVDYPHRQAAQDAHVILGTQVVFFFLMEARLGQETALVEG